MGISKIMLVNCVKAGVFFIEMLSFQHIQHLFARNQLA